VEAFKNPECAKYFLPSNDRDLVVANPSIIASCTVAVPLIAKMIDFVISFLKIP